MKQAKFALTAVAILAVVGGALAFKASRGFNTTVFTNTVGGCKQALPVSNYITTPDDQAAKLIINSATLVSTTAPCTAPLTLYRAD